MNLDILDDQGNSQPQSQPSQETEVSIRYSSIGSVLFSASESGSVLFSASESGSVLFLVSPLFNARFQVPVLSALRP
ncbi:uncharacterized protein OCT59_000035 [Rhizophagus irregularis]|uniref:uncharacterized protein n=1 Tax=Rhizophagus irregularis TaxID=588596 RepID=UPI003328F19A|nr:hypothetical protein OCT59_000035 [Rhizophagus irregularis]